MDRLKSELEDIDEYKSTFTCPFFVTKKDNITAALSQGVCGHSPTHLQPC